MSKKPNAGTERVTATKTAFKVIEGIKALDGAGVTELARFLDLPKSTVHKHLVTLRDLGYVYTEDRQYILGYKFVNLSRTVEDRSELFRVMKPAVDTLAEMSEESAGLCVVNEHQLINIYWSDNGRSGEKEASGGRSHDFHASAAGKAILAQSSDEAVRECLGRNGTPERTENTITDEHELMNEISRIRERGIAFDREEQWADLRSVGLPVTSGQGAEVGAIYVLGPANRMSGKRFQEDIPVMMRGVVDKTE